MAIGRMRHDWDQTSLMWATYANAFRDSKKQTKPFEPYTVHPFRKAEKEVPVEANISVLKMLLK